MRVTPPILGVTGGVIERGQRKFQEVFTKLCNFSTSFKAKKNHVTSVATWFFVAEKEGFEPSRRVNALLP